MIFWLIVCFIKSCYDEDKKNSIEELRRIVEEKEKEKEPLSRSLIGFEDYGYIPNKKREKYNAETLYKKFIDMEYKYMVSEYAREKRSR